MNATVSTEWPAAWSVYGPRERAEVIRRAELLIDAARARPNIRQRLSKPKAAVLLGAVSAERDRLLHDLSHWG